MYKILLVIFAFIYIWSLSSRAEELIFVIRVDDIQSRNTTMIPRTIIDFEQAVQERGGKVTWAVIPHRLMESQNQDGQLSAQLRTSLANGHEIVLHGYNHICPLCYQSSHEMYCTSRNQSHSYEVQAGMLNDALQILEDSLQCKPDVFVPPGHHADTTTYRALLDFEIPRISTTGQTRSEIYSGLFNLAPDNEFTWTLSTNDYQAKLSQALYDIETKRRQNGYYCLLLHDPFIRHGYENGLVIRWTAELLDSLINRYGSDLRFSTLGEAASHFTDTQTAIAVQGAPIAETATMLSNYPNPFNPSTQITFNLNMPADTRLTIYDVLGRTVKQIDTGRLRTGHYMYTWNGNDRYGRPAVSGIYLCQLRYNAEIATRRLLLLR